jgi:hypothetical protein
MGILSPGIGAVKRISPTDFQAGTHAKAVADPSQSLSHAMPILARDDDERRSL